MPYTDKFLISIGPLVASDSLIVVPSASIEAVTPVTLVFKLICLANSDGSSPVISVVMVTEPRLPERSKVHDPGF